MNNINEYLFILKSPSHRSLWQPFAAKSQSNPINSDFLIEFIGKAGQPYYEKIV